VDVEYQYGPYINTDPLWTCGRGFGSIEHLKIRLV